MPRLILMLVAAVLAAGQTPDLERAYEALRTKDYDSAIQGFRQALALAPNQSSIHKDLAYTLLKIGETEAGRDEFTEAVRLDPADDHIALEYAFLCYETNQKALARRIFDRLRKTGNQTVAQAFENIDRPLREGIARWKRVLETSPDNFSAHEELAHLAEQADQLDLAAQHYETAWKLRPDRRALLVDLGRVWTAENRLEEGNTALLAASRGAEPRTAEEAQELLPKRYPFVYEFQRALDLDPSNTPLRRELAYLYVAMSNHAGAEKELERVIQEAPGDLESKAQLGLLRLDRGDSAGAMPLLEQVIAGADDELANRIRNVLHLPPKLQKREEQPSTTGSSDIKQLADKSLEKGYLKDAVKYLLIEHENDPDNFDVMLKLGQTYNNLKDDEEAVKWFNLAQLSPDTATAQEAARAYRNLKPSAERFRTSVWVFPMFSTRWHDLFAYAQAKIEPQMPNWFVRPYLSLRFIGDTSGAVELAGTVGPQYLSERSAILALGVATKSWKGLTGWFEAGESFRYAPTQQDPGRVVPDYRGGLTYARGIGAMLAGGAHGLYAETNDDGIFVSRFSKDTLFYSQNRTGYTFRAAEGAGGFHAQLYWNWNATVDGLRQYWANYVETGPGIRFRVEALGPLIFSVNALRGAYLVNQGNPRGPNFNDIRAGIWYSFSK
ncbi:MAG: tetratricopeptide repeat protein [Bryobacteraceae bacterium]